MLPICQTLVLTTYVNLFNPYDTIWGKQTFQRDEKAASGRLGNFPTVTQLGGGTATSGYPAPSPGFLLLIIFYRLSLDNSTVFLETKGERNCSNCRLDWRVILKELVKNEKLSTFIEKPTVCHAFYVLAQ